MLDLDEIEVLMRLRLRFGVRMTFLGVLNAAEKLDLRENLCLANEVSRHLTSVDRYMRVCIALTSMCSIENSD